MANGKILLWAALIVLFASLAWLVWPQSASRQPLPPTSVSNPASLPTPSLTLPPPPSPTVGLRSPLLTVPPVGVVTTLIPASEAVGWASTLDGRSHFGFPNIHAGFLNGHIYHGALQFDLSAIPAGSTITYAALELTGLDAQYLSPGGTWQLHLLNPAIDAVWPNLTYAVLHHAAVDTTVSPALTSADLGQGQVNLFIFGPEQLAVLEQRLSQGMVSFRLDGPTSGNDNLFTWDSGYRTEEALKTRPKLRLVVLPPPTPEYVIVTSTPTPENVITAAAMAAAIGTYTPAPANWVTPVVVTPRPTPANSATIAYQNAAATAEAFLFGPPTPTPPNLWTATPRLDKTNAPDLPAAGSVFPTNSSAPAGTPGADYLIVTSTPTPENVITAAAMAATATKVAATIGTYTPVPPNWVTPIVVTPRPTPANTVTVVYQNAAATAEAFLFGPPTPTPPNLWTATPTPIFVLLAGEVATPWATLTPTPTPPPIPAALVGKIAFLSNRSGGPESLKKPLVYVIDPDGSNLAVLTNPAVYYAAQDRDFYSADQRFRVFVKDALRFDGKWVPALYFYDYFYNAEDQITQFGAGVAWDPAWSPTREQIAFVSNDSANDEIWVINRDGSHPRQLTLDNEGFNARRIGKDTFIPEVNGHPSWSPDGSQIVFWSNRTGTARYGS